MTLEETSTNRPTGVLEGCCYIGWFPDPVATCSWSSKARTSTFCGFDAISDTMPSFWAFSMLALAFLTLSLSFFSFLRVSFVLIDSNSSSTGVGGVFLQRALISMHWSRSSSAQLHSHCRRTSLAMSVASMPPLFKVLRASRCRCCRYLQVVSLDILDTGPELVVKFIPVYTLAILSVQ